MPCQHLQHHAARNLRGVHRRQADGEAADGRPRHRRYRGACCRALTLATATRMAREFRGPNSRPGARGARRQGRRRGRRASPKRASRRPRRSWSARKRTSTRCWAAWMAPSMSDLELQRLPGVVRSMEPRDFTLAALKTLGARLTPNAPNLYSVGGKWRSRIYPLRRACRRRHTEARSTRPALPLSSGSLTGL